MQAFQAYLMTTHHSYNWPSTEMQGSKCTQVLGRQLSLRFPTPAKAAGMLLEYQNKGMARSKLWGKSALDPGMEQLNYK